MANIAVATVEPWVDDGAWRFSGPRNVSAGVLSLDAAANGPVSTHLYYKDPLSASSCVGKTMYQCFEFSVSTTGSFRFGVNQIPHAFVNNLKLIEFVLNGTQVDFFMRGTVPTGFDGSLSVPSTTLTVRMAIYEEPTGNSSRVRYGIYTGAGVLVVDSGWLSAATQYYPNWLYSRGTLYGPEGASSTCTTVDPVGMGGYGGLDNAGNAVGVLYNAVSTQTVQRPALTHPAFVSLTGVTTVQPYLSIVNCSSGDVDTFMTGGASALTTLVATPATPTVTVTTYGPGSHSVVIATTSPDCAIWATIDEGAFGTDAVSIATNKRTHTSQVGTSLSLIISDPSTIRAIAYNGKLSGVVTQYVGPTTAVPVPEVSPRATSIIPGSATLVRIYCADQAATIRYTTDGSDPTSGSTAYTGPLFLRDVTRLKVAAFNAGNTSVVKNALFWLTTPTSNNQALTLETNVGVPWEPIQDLKKASSWNTNGNATFNESAGTILINDPNGYGVSLRSDLFPYQNGSISVVRFVATGGLQLKVPGQELYLSWKNNALGFTTSPTATPSTDCGVVPKIQINLMFIRVYAGCQLAGIDYILLDGAGNPSGGVLTLADNNPYNLGFWPDASESWPGPIPAGLNFTSKSMSAYTISGVEALITKELAPYVGEVHALNYSAAFVVRNSPYPWVVPQRAVFTLPNGSNFAGASLSASVTDDSAVTMLAATSVGETHFAGTFSSVVAAGYTPLPTDSVSRVQLLAFTRNSESTVTRLAAASGHGSRPTSEIGEWNITRECSDNEFTDGTGPLLYVTPVEFRRDSPAWDPGSYLPQLALPQASLREFHEVVFTYPYADLDTGSAWFRIRPSFAFGISHQYGQTFEVAADRSCDSYLTCGWDIDRSTYAALTKVVSVGAGAGVGHRSDPRPEASAYAYMQQTNTATWSDVPGTSKLPVVATEKHVWYCGRKISAGHMFVRTVVLPETDLTNVIADTGWVDCGTVPATLPRPRVIYRTRWSPQGSLRGEHTGNSFMRGWQSLGDTQLENCFSYGSPTPLPLPVITDSAGTSADISTYPPGSTPENGSNLVPMVWDPTANGGAGALYVHAGASALRRRNSLETLQGHEGLLTSSGTILMSTMSTVHVANLGDPIQESTKNMYGALQPMRTSWDSRSPVQNYNFTHQTTDYISIQSTLPRHVILQFNKPALLPVTDGTAFWKIVFSDGYEQTVTAQLTDDVERVLDAGTYTVKFVRVVLNAGVTSDVGETLPASFTVSDHIALTTTAPTTVQLNTATPFQAATTATGVSYRWEFSDGYVAETATVSRTITKAGRYTWSLTVVDDVGDSAQAEGKFVAPWTTGTLTPPTSLTLGTTGVKIS